MITWYENKNHLLYLLKYAPLAYTKHTKYRFEFYKIKGIMKKLSLILFLFSFCLTLSAQSQKISGTKWEAKTYELETAEGEEKLEITNSIWRDVFAGLTHLHLKRDGSLSFTTDGNPTQSTWEIQDGTFRVSFTNHRGKISYTVYNYSLSGKDLTLTREDPIIKETYVFTLK